MDEAKQYYRSRRGRLNDWVSDVKTRLDRLHIKLEDLEIISPRYIIHEYIDYLQRQKQVRPGERIVRRLVVYECLESDCRTIDFNEFIARFKSPVELVDALSKNPVVLVEETPPRVFELRVKSISGGTYTGKPVELEGTKPYVLRIEGSTRADEEYPVVVIVELVDDKNRVVRRLEEKTLTK